MAITWPTDCPWSRRQASPWTLEAICICSRTSQLLASSFTLVGQGLTWSP
uniref:Alternative protein C15orf58 n=1 Tax=Homo sapiens TaxID=9606 RepID=L8E8I1_HUMAN|nr:alternative protein C15orf58 [Homo sapiens]